MINIKVCNYLAFFVICQANFISFNTTYFVQFGIEIYIGWSKHYLLRMLSAILYAGFYAFLTFLGAIALISP